MNTYVIKLARIHGIDTWLVINSNTKAIHASFMSEYSAIVRANKLNHV